MSKLTPEQELFCLAKEQAKEIKLRLTDERRVNWEATIENALLQFVTNWEKLKNGPLRTK